MFCFRLQQYQIALQTSNDRLKIFYDQLNNHIKNKQEISLFLIKNEKRINQLKINLSNLGVSKITCILYLFNQLKKLLYILCNFRF